MPVPTIKNGLGWLPQPYDARDFKYAKVFKLTPPLPHTDLRPVWVQINDQGNLGACVGNGSAEAVQFARNKQSLPSPPPARLMIYYDARDLEGTTQQDAGCIIRDAIKQLAAIGVCPESEWPYDITKFAIKPPPQCYTDALKECATNYYAIDNTVINEIKSCLADGYPVIFGFNVYESFYSVGSNGIVPMPKPTDQPIGGHCMVIVGNDDSKNWFICVNSWGADWGDHGFCYIPYAYLTDPNQASDFWTIRLTTVPAPTPTPTPPPTPPTPPTPPMPPTPTPAPSGTVVVTTTEKCTLTLVLKDKYGNPVTATPVWGISDSTKLTIALANDNLSVVVTPITVTDPNNLPEVTVSVNGVSTALAVSVPS